MKMSNSRNLTRRDIIKQGLAATTGLAAASLINPGLAMGKTNSKRPNVILIYTDDHNFDQIGSYGHNVHTPHQDSIGRHGVRFTRGYTTISVCTPSRYSCLTGQYPGRFHARSKPGGVQLEPSFNTVMEPDFPNIARLMQQAGYKTGMVGKWDQGGAENLKPLPGPDPWVASKDKYDPRDPKISKILRHNHDCFRKSIKDCGFDYAESIYFGNPESFGNHALNIHNAEWVTEGALNFINQNKNKPFFLYFSPTLHHLPHPQESLLQADPRITPAGYLDKAPNVQPPRAQVMQRAIAAGCAPETAYCTWLDDSIGAVLNSLKELNLDDNTMIIFCSDNQTPAKVTLFEGGVRVPFMIRWPDRIKPRQVSSRLAQNIDFLPTILDACGITPPLGVNYDGKSLMPMLLGQKDKIHDHLFFEIGWTRAVCTERWKYLALRHSESAKKLIEKGESLYHDTALKPHQHKVLLEHPNFWDPDQLYDLRTDNIETVNLAYDPKHADTLSDMKAKLSTWLKTFGDHPFGEFA